MISFGKAWKGFLAQHLSITKLSFTLGILHILNIFLNHKIKDKSILQYWFYGTEIEILAAKVGMEFC